MIVSRRSCRRFRSPSSVFGHAGLILLLLFSSCIIPPSFQQQLEGITSVHQEQLGNKDLERHEDHPISEEDDASHEKKNPDDDAAAAIFGESEGGEGQLEQNCGSKSCNAASHCERYGCYHGCNINSGWCNSGGVGPSPLPPNPAPNPTPNPPTPSGGSCSAIFCGNDPTICRNLGCGSCGGSGMCDGNRDQCLNTNCRNNPNLCTNIGCNACRNDGYCGPSKPLPSQCTTFFCQFASSSSYCLDNGCGSCQWNGYCGPYNGGGGNTCTRTRCQNSSRSDPYFCSNRGCGTCTKSGYCSGDNPTPDVCTDKFCGTNQFLCASEGCGGCLRTGYCGNPSTNQCPGIYCGGKSDPSYCSRRGCAQSECDSFGRCRSPSTTVVCTTIFCGLDANTCRNRGCGTCGLNGYCEGSRTTCSQRYCRNDPNVCPNIGCNACRNDGYCGPAKSNPSQCTSTYCRNAASNHCSFNGCGSCQSSGYCGRSSSTPDQCRNTNCGFSSDPNGYCRNQGCGYCSFWANCEPSSEGEEEGGYSEEHPPAWSRIRGGKGGALALTLTAEVKTEEDERL